LIYAANNFSPIGNIDMDSEKLNSWLALLANFGVVLGLALLAYELQQTQNLSETEAAVRRLNQIQEARLEFATSEFLPPIRVKARTEGIQALSAVEIDRLRDWESTVRLRMRSQYIEYVRGYLDQETADGVVRNAAAFLPYWEELGYEMGDNEFEQAIKKAAGR
jgi:hypothetical protein